MPTKKRKLKIKKVTGGGPIPNNTGYTVGIFDENGNALITVPLGGGQGASDFWDYIKKQNDGMNKGGAPTSHAIVMGDDGKGGKKRRRPRKKANKPDKPKKK